jgi:hypothetical protein
MHNNKFELKKTVSEILVVNDKDLSPYIEVINFSPENITQKPLGTLLGFFEIKDNDQDSAYIVNFLSSVAKKEYFSNPKRPPADSFEAALHKVNLALSEIAKHNNVSWIGKLEIALCAITANQIHFGVTGSARIFLIRSGQMIEISEGLASEEAVNNPIKTFVDISSGRLEDQDKIIITSEDIFHVLSEKEIRDGARNFSDKKFARFIQTALVNELPIAGTVIVDFFKKEVEPAVKKTPKPRKVAEKNTMEIPNAFSSNAFRSPQSDTDHRQPQIKTQKEPKNDYDEEYVDRKTGHIYLKDDYKYTGEETNLDKFNTAFKEKCFDVKCWAQDNIVRKISLKGMAGILKIALESTLTATDKVLEMIKNKKASIQNKEEVDDFEKEIHESKQQKNEVGESTLGSANLRGDKITPSLSRIKSMFFEFNGKQKAYALAIIVFIIITPLILKSITGKKKQEAAEITRNEISAPTPDSPEEKLKEEENISLETTANRIHLNSSPNITTIKMVDEELFAISGNKVLVFENNELKKEFLFPEDFSKSKTATFMDSLNLFLILTENNQVLGFNAKSKKFQHNNIEIPENSEIQAMGTFLTYLYIADTKNNQIYRYPRITGGFGEKTEWIKDDVDIEEITDMSISDRIVLSQGENEPIILFKGLLEEKIEFKDSKTSISWDKLITTEEMQKTYVLDQKNSRVVTFNEMQEIEKQIYNEYIADATSFNANEDGTVYISTPSEIYLISE